MPSNNVNGIVEDLANNDEITILAIKKVYLMEAPFF
tara:strand:+ start:167 stop:274 length:108 start_codon:yes stop_codon:yes gene_type:complete